MGKTLEALSRRRRQTQFMIALKIIANLHGSSGTPQPSCTSRPPTRTPLAFERRRAACFCAGSRAKSAWPHAEPFASQRRRQELGPASLRCAAEVFNIAWGSPAGSVFLASATPAEQIFEERARMSGSFASWKTFAAARPPRCRVDYAHIGSTPAPRPR